MNFTDLLSILIGTGCLAVFVAAGVLAARRALPDGDITVVLPLGCGFSVTLLAALPALFAIPFGFTLPAVLLGTAAAGALAVWLWCTRVRGALPKAGNGGAFWACVLPLLAVTLWLFNTHVLCLKDGAYHTGQSCYGDLAMHLAYVKAFAVSGAFPPLNNLLAGAGTLSYPYLCETTSSFFVVLGLPLREAYLLPVIPCLVAVYGMAWQLARRVLGSAAKAVLAFWLFFMGSGFGFCWFLESGEKFASIFTAFYNTPTNYTDANIIWVNPVVDLLIPQRATLFGWAVLFPALYLLWRFCFEEERRLWLPLALLVLPLPLLHTHSALALVILCVVCGVYTLVCRPRKAANLPPWLWLALVCGAVWLPEAAPTVFGHAVSGQNMIRLHFNWVNGGDDGVLKDNYFWFYIKNIGLVYLLLVPAFLHANRKQRWFYGGGLAILALAEFVVFQPNYYDNNKLLFLWHFLGCLLVASLLWDTAGKMRTPAARAAMLAGACFLGMFGSVLTFGRELASDYTQWNADDIALAAYLDENTAPDALFLTSESHLCPTASLAGRQILCGSGSFLYFHGDDYTAQSAAVKTLYEAPSEALLATWGVNYAVFDSYVYGLYAPDEDWYAARYPVFYENDGCRVYTVG